MLLFLLGMVFGVGLTVLYYEKLEVNFPWYSWVLFALGMLSLMFSFDVLFGSIAEHEIKAAWLGFGIFALVGFVMLILGWRQRPATQTE